MRRSAGIFLFVGGRPVSAEAAGVAGAAVAAGSAGGVTVAVGVSGGAGCEGGVGFSCAERGPGSARKKKSRWRHRGKNCLVEFFIRESLSD